MCFSIKVTKSIMALIEEKEKTTHDMLQPTDYNNHKPNCHIELTKSTKGILEITALAAG